LETVRKSGEEVSSIVGTEKIDETLRCDPPIFALYQKEVSVSFFNAILKFERYKARHRSNNGFRFPEGVLKCRFLTGLNVEDRDF
jgi:hypothetical protein